MTDCKPGFYLSVSDTIMYIDEGGLEYHPDSNMDPSKADAAGIKYVQCAGGTSYFHSITKSSTSSGQQDATIDASSRSSTGPSSSDQQNNGTTVGTNANATTIVDPGNGGNLPPGWAECIDPDSGATYYRDEINHVSTLERPGGKDNDERKPGVSVEEGVQEAESEEQLPPGWAECIDPDSGATYYRDEINLVSTLERPRGKKASEQASEQNPRVQVEEGIREDEENKQHKLPPGWAEYMDPDSGVTYYRDEINQISTLQRPENNRQRETDLTKAAAKEESSITQEANDEGRVEATLVDASPISNGDLTLVQSHSDALPEAIPAVTTDTIAKALPSFIAAQCAKSNVEDNAVVTTISCAGDSSNPAIDGTSSVAEEDSSNDSSDSDSDDSSYDSSDDESSIGSIDEEHLFDVPPPKHEPESQPAAQPTVQLVVSSAPGEKAKAVPESAVDGDKPAQDTLDDSDYWPYESSDEEEDEPLPPLPPGWTEDVRCGMPYFFHKGLNAATYKRPTPDDDPAVPKKEEPKPAIPIESLPEAPPTAQPVVSSAPKAETKPQSEAGDGGNPTENPLDDSDYWPYESSNEEEDESLPPLPPGWTEDVRCGMPYFFHKGLNAATYKRPAPDDDPAMPKPDITKQSENNDKAQMQAESSDDTFAKVEYPAQAQSEDTDSCQQQTDSSLSTLPAPPTIPEPSALSESSLAEPTTEISTEEICASKVAPGDWVRTPEYLTQLRGQIHLFLEVGGNLNDILPDHMHVQPKHQASTSTRSETSRGRKDGKKEKRSSGSKSPTPQKRSSKYGHDDEAGKHRKRSDTSSGQKKWSSRGEAQRKRSSNLPLPRTGSCESITRNSRRDGSRGEEHESHLPKVGSPGSINRHSRQGGNHGEEHRRRPKSVDGTSNTMKRQRSYKRDQDKVGRDEEKAKVN